MKFEGEKYSIHCGLSLVYNLTSNKITYKHTNKTRSFFPFLILYEALDDDDDNDDTEQHFQFIAIQQLFYQLFFLNYYLQYTDNFPKVENTK